MYFCKIQLESVAQGNKQNKWQAIYWQLSSSVALAWLWSLWGGAVTGNLSLAKYLASKQGKKYENHSPKIAVDHKTCSVNEF